MKREEYQQARVKLGLKVTGEGQWLDTLGISYDTHKSYSSGRSEVMRPVANHIATLLAHKEFLLAHQKGIFACSPKM